MLPALIPFLEHDDANRALMGSICRGNSASDETEDPIVGTWIERKVAVDSGRQSLLLSMVEWFMSMLKSVESNERT